jgi:hypothetical protein
VSKAIFSLAATSFHSSYGGALISAEANVKLEAGSTGGLKGQALFWPRLE